MSRYGDYDLGYAKEELYNHIEDFLSEYSIYDLMSVLTDYLEYHKLEEKKEEKELKF